MLDTATQRPATGMDESVLSMARHPRKIV
jgi:hypothetical protein